MFNKFRKYISNLIAPKEYKSFNYSPPRIRNYQAGMLDRLASSFGASYLSADREILPALKVMRGRSRNLAMNNPYMRKFLKSLVVNVIGHEGIILQNQAKDDNGKFDDAANKIIEEHWHKFSEEGVCDVTGELSLHEFLSLCLESTARDGETLIRIIRGWNGNKYRIAFQLIEADLLDENYNRELPNGNKIVMGVEKDRWGRRIAYHLLTKHPGDYSIGGLNYEVVPASEILPVFISERIGQTRGVPWAYASMMLLNNIGEYTEAAIINARVGASKMGFYKSTLGSDFSAIADMTSTSGEFLEEVEPGVFGKIPPGWDFQEFNPQYPNNEFPEFNKAMLRGAATGVLMAYSSMSADLADVNFSSIRSGKIDERDMYKYIQKWFIRKTVKKMFPIWLDTALMVGAITFPTGKALPYVKFDKFNAATWQPRGFDWVDPKNDIEAEMIAINFGLKTRAESAAERGKDLRDIFEQLKREKEMAAEYGLDFSIGKTEAAEKEKKSNDNKAENDAVEALQREFIAAILSKDNGNGKHITIENQPQDINLNIELKPEGKVTKKTLIYQDLNGNTKKAEVIEEDI